MIQEVVRGVASADLLSDASEIAAEHVPVAPSASIAEIVGQVSAKAALYFGNDPEAVDATVAAFYDIAMRTPRTISVR